MGIADPLLTVRNRAAAMSTASIGICLLVTAGHPQLRSRSAETSANDEKRGSEVSSDVFPIWRIIIDAIVSAVISLLILLLLRWRKVPSAQGVGEACLVAVVAGLSVLFWRSCANVPALNVDAIPGVSPADALSLIATYVGLGIYGAFRPALQLTGEGGVLNGWAQTRAILAFVAFVVNVVVI